MIRESTKQGHVQPYTMMVLYQNNIYNLKVRVRPDGKMALGEEKPDEMVRPECTCSTVTSTLEFGLELVLSTPWLSQTPTAWRQHFEWDHKNWPCFTGPNCSKSRHHWLAKILPIRHKHMVQSINLANSKAEGSKHRTWNWNGDVSIYWTYIKQQIYKTSTWVWIINIHFCLLGV